VLELIRNGGKGINNCKDIHHHSVSSNVYLRDVE
jgi:hypothetical protein